jgi:AcrR family transcriptional regulator
MRRRAEQVAQTRQRIVEAAVALHGSAGPANTTIAAIAARAKVTRVTVYRHFPDEAALFDACSAHWLSRHQPPDPAAWAKISDPAARLQAGLAGLYQFYRAGASMLACVYRDFAALPEAHQRRHQDQADRLRDLLAAPFGGNPGQQRLTRAVTGHAISFWTWHSLCLDQGLTDREAAEIMVSAVLAAQAQAASEPGQPAQRDRSG